MKFYLFNSKSIIIKTFFVLLILLCFILKYFDVNIKYFYNKYIPIKSNRIKNIIELKNYYRFNKIKSMFCKDPFFQIFLKEINIIFIALRYSNLLLIFQKRDSLKRMKC